MQLQLSRNTPIQITFGVLCLFPYLYLTKLVGLYSLFIFLICGITLKNFQRRYPTFGPEILLVLPASLLLLRSISNQDVVRMIFTLTIGMFSILILFSWKISINNLQVIVKDKSNWDALLALLCTSLPILVLSMRLPNSQFSWMLGGDGNNWFTQLRLIQVINSSRFRDLLSNSPGASFFADLFNPSRSPIPSEAFFLDLSALLNLQILSAVTIAAIVTKRLHLHRINHRMRFVVILLVTQFGSILGMSGLNGFLSASPTILILICLMFLSQIDLQKRLRYEALLYFSIFILLLFTWSILIPFVLTQYVYFRLHKVDFKRFWFLTVISIALFTYLALISGVIIIRSIDRKGYLTIPRGGIWQTFDVHLLIGILILLFALLFQAKVPIMFYVIQIFTLGLICQILFSVYNPPLIWAPWSSYYPQKVFTLFYLAICLWILMDLLIVVKEKFILIPVVFLLCSNLFLELPNPMLQKTVKFLNPTSLTILERQGAEAITFIRARIDERRPFVFWDFYDWPAESSANAWVGLAWEKYPGNWSMRKDDLTFNTNYSGPIGNRNYHNGNPIDESNLCRLIELLPEESVIYTRNPLTVYQLKVRCAGSKNIEIRTE